MSWRAFIAVLRALTAWEWVQVGGGTAVGGTLLALFISIALDIRQHRRIRRMLRALEAQGRRVASDASVVCVHGLAFSEPCEQCAAELAENFRGMGKGGGR